MKTITLSLALLSVTLASCTSTGYTPKPGKPATLTVGVKPFTTPGYASLTAEDKGLRDYEQLAMPAMLIEALKVTPGVSSVYFTPGNSPGVDVVVDGVIRQSNGRDTDIALTATRSDGKVLSRKSFSLRHYVDNVQVVETTNKGFFQRASGIFTTAKQKFSCDPDDLRALVYAEAKKTASTPELVKMGNEAAKVERQQLLEPLTKALTPRIAATSGLYHAWQKESVPYLNQQDLAAAQQASAEADAMFGMLMSFAGGMAAGYSAGMGDSLGMMSAMPMISSGVEMQAQGQADAAVAANKIRELTAALARQKVAFATGDGRAVTVRIYNKVYTLKGSKDEMTKEFRKIVKEEMTKELQKSQALAAATVAAG